MAEGRNMQYKIKTNKLIKAYLIDFGIESCVDGSIFEKVIRHNKMQTSTMYNNMLYSFHTERDSRPKEWH
jgi:hypothetical protein